MITIQLKENMIQGWLLSVINKVTTEVFIIFRGYYWRFLEWAIGQYICNVYLKCFIFIIIHILVLILQSTCFICRTLKHKLWNNNCTVHVNERNQNKRKTNSRHIPRVLLFNLAYKQCNAIIKGWLHCLKSKSNGRFVNNILFGSAWCLVMLQIQFSLIEKNKDWTSRTLANPRPNPIPTPRQSGHHMCIILLRDFQLGCLNYLLFEDNEKHVIDWRDLWKSTFLSLL